jgi:hypothetical protein
VGLRKFPEGWVTWIMLKTRQNDNYVQIDLNPANLPYYNPEEKFSAEYPNWYLVNQKYSDGTL